MKKTTLICFFISLCLILISCSNNAHDGAIDDLTDNPGKPENNSKDNSSEKTITLGGMYLSDNLLREVKAFNEKSETLRIQVINYFEEAEYDWAAAEMRLHTELIAGKGPDILVDFGSRYTNNKLFVDLYPFIDNDNELERSDFFPNVLSAFEGTDGALRFVADRFVIQTMIGITEDLAFINSWTPHDLLGILDDLKHMQAPLGQYMDREGFVKTMIAFSGDEFINWEQYKANLDSDEFIRILEASRSLPNHIISDDDTSEFTRLRRGEHLVSFALVYTPRRYQEFVVALGDIRAIGVPTSQGGSDIIVPYNETLGITASSEHKEEAWSFIRRVLMSPYRTGSVNLSEVFSDGFPMRIELYDELIAETMSSTAAPATVEGPLLLGEMTQTEADDLRAIIENAKPVGQWLDIDIWRHLEGDMNTFYSGGKTATETAKLMQFRIQTYLDELS
ncbi:MAG: hypothetical protein FWD44_07770 [Oscillospiraceae bacterium]|nr:hypothetical protein [Oscillospiraceae bacterium]